MRNIVKSDWDIFKAKFSENPQKNFEWFCYLLFCREHKKDIGIFRYKNQSGIETNPIEEGNELIGWQSKFYETTLSEHKTVCSSQEPSGVVKSIDKYSGNSSIFYS
ncbi:hypothetical protein GCM10008905_20240 [Clostridium malenominatum]|uniref:Uncharacterized protein n=1 Tax=Clostridium malenominatum TaxID=1539 RepID=A0ABN1J0N1_9CLOT